MADADPEAVDGSGRTTPYVQTEARAWPGVTMIPVVAAVLAAGIVLIVLGTGTRAAGIVVVFAGWCGLMGFIVVQPNESRVLIVFGRYTGTVLHAGLWWVNPLTRFWRRKVSLRIGNFQGAKLKVNDSSGNPVEIAAVVVWRVFDTAKAVFEVQDYEQFVVVQSEAAVRHLAAQFPYDDYAEGAISLRRNTDLVLEALQVELQQRLRQAGLAVLETRLTHLAYASEVAEVMLRRQQAEALVAARRTMVEGAVGMVEMALDRLAEREIVELDPERKAAMVSNLMVVLTGDHSAAPVINAGSLYT
jgi:regulator of protease activity HflC (stomatin/prohibitin superfamily)